MAAPTELAFDRLPNTNALLLRALRPRPSVLASGQDIPLIRATLSPSVPAAAHVAAYRALCGFAADGTLPCTYPHVLAAPLHLAMLTHDAFPLRLLGAVHVRNQVRQHRVLAATDALGVTVTVEGHTDVDQGVEVDLRTSVDSGGALVWESVSTMLIRSGKGGGKGSAGKAYTPPDLTGYTPVADIRAPQDMGRRYGRVASDLNPIHLYAVTARAFGFPRAIAHGMWTFARCVAELQRAQVVGPVALEVAFKRPLLLPSTAHLTAQHQGNTTAFVAHDDGVKTVFLTGQMTSV